MFLQPLNRPVRNWRGMNIWVVGASSGIGAALARAMLQQGANVAVSARSASVLESLFQSDANAMVLPLDVNEQQAWKLAHEKMRARWGQVDMLVYCVADYVPERSWEMHPDRARRMVMTNLAAYYDALALLLPSMLQAGKGHLALIASVAGYVGLPKATVYGPTKAALINLAEILYNDLHQLGINVFLINPGFIATRLTEKNDFAMPALLGPEQAAAAIMAGMERGEFEIHFPRRFTSWLKLIQLMPYRWRFALMQRLVTT